jgi:aminopeptidase YwaD
MLCCKLKERPVGSKGNRLATDFFQGVLESHGWEVASTAFKAMEWEDHGADLWIEDQHFQIYPSPYSLGCSIRAELLKASTISEITQLETRGKILYLDGDLAREQLMPKNFSFYNPEEHQRLIALLEEKDPAAILSATPRNPASSGGIYPVPLFEDGDFDIPSAFLTKEEGKKLDPLAGKTAHLISNALRIPGNAYNLIGRKGKNPQQRIVISAHIDAKQGTPGAIDNATGVIILMLLAEMLEGYSGKTTIELTALNGEDYFSTPGQMVYLAQNRERFHEILLNINIDGAGYYQGPAAFSFFNIGENKISRILEVLGKHPGIVEERAWMQGDHSLFIQQGVPAIAVTSQWLLENFETQDITHTPKDNPKIVDCSKVVEISRVIYQLLSEVSIQ